VLDSAGELFAAALVVVQLFGDDVDPRHWDQAAAVIRKAKPYWAAFNSSSYIKELTLGNIWVVQQAVDRDQGRPLTAVIRKYSNRDTRQLDAGPITRLLARRQA
jgi:hypothetical protein